MRLVFSGRWEFYFLLIMVNVFPLCFYLLLNFLQQSHAPPLFFKGELF